MSFGFIFFSFLLTFSNQKPFSFFLFLAFQREFRALGAVQKDSPAEREIPVGGLDGGLCSCLDQGMSPGQILVSESS